MGMAGCLLAVLGQHAAADEKGLMRPGGKAVHEYIARLDSERLVEQRQALGGTLAA